MKTLVIWAHPVHMPTEEQIRAMGNVEVKYLKDEYPHLTQMFLNCPTTSEELDKLAEHTIELFHIMAKFYNGNIVSIKDFYQVGGSMAFQVALGKALAIGNTDIKLHYSHSERVSVDKPLPDGSIEKTSIFKFQKWISL